MAKSREAEIVDKEFAASQKNKRMIEVYYGNASSDTGSDRFLNQCDSGANYYSVFEKTENGTDRACRWCAVTSEKGRNTHHGRNHLPAGSCGNVPVLYQRLSKDYSDSVSDTWFWTDWFFG